jgi:hypothetical protein
MAVETYVVSVYRRSDESGKEVAGLIDRTGSGDRKAFSSGEELWAFLCAVSTVPRRRRRRAGHAASVSRNRADRKFVREKKKPAEAGSEGCYKRLCSLTLHFAFAQRCLVEHTVFHDRQ